MATTSLWPIHNTGGRGVRTILNKLVEYAENGEKTTGGNGVSGSGRSNSEVMQSVMGYASRSDKVSAGKDAAGEITAHAIPSEEESKEEMKQVLGILSEQGEGVRFVTGVNCSPERAVDEMMITKNRWPDRGNRLLYHGYQSFTPGEVTPEQAHSIGVRMARELWGDRFGRKFIWDREYPRMRQRSDELCREERLSVVEEAADMEMRLHRGAVWAERQGKPTVQSVVKEDVDCCIQASNSLTEWMSLMRAKGYRIDDSGKYLRVFPYGHSKCIRLDRRFGEEYSLDGIAQQIEKHGIVPERKELTEEDAAKKIYREMVQRGKRRHKPAGKPKGIQVRYLGFLFRIGYHKSPAQIARTHYLLREELTKLDQYIEESKFLIYSDISTVDQLKERKMQDQKEMNKLYRSKINLERMLPVSNSEEKKSAEEQLVQIKASIKKMHKNLRSEKGILRRMGEMDAKEKKLERVRSGLSIGNPYRRNRNRQIVTGQERSNQYG